MSAIRFAGSTLAVVAVLTAGTIGAHAREFCAAKVLQAESLPFAPEGFWLTKATLEVGTSTTPSQVVTVRENPLAQLALRGGEVFRIPCQYASGAGLSLMALATASSARNSTADYARLR